MKTYLPYPDFARSARSLTDEHLSESVQSASQTLLALTGEAPREGTPTEDLWDGYLGLLAVYTICMVNEQVNRESITSDEAEQALMHAQHTFDTTELYYSPWMDEESFFVDERTALSATDSQHYSTENFEHWTTV